MVILNIYVWLSLALPIKGYQPYKICLIFEKRWKHPTKGIKSEQKSHHQIQRIRKPICRRFKLLSAKKWNFVFLCQKKDHGWVFICFFFSCFFFQGRLYHPSGPRASSEGSIERKLKFLALNLSDQKDWRATPPLFSQNRLIKILDCYFCSPQLKVPIIMLLDITWSPPMTPRERSKL